MKMSKKRILKLLNGRNNTLKKKQKRNTRNGKKKQKRNTRTGKKKRKTTLRGGAGDPNVISSLNDLVQNNTLGNKNLYQELDPLDPANATTGITPTDATTGAAAGAADDAPAET